MRASTWLPVAILAFFAALLIHDSLESLRGMLFPWLIGGIGSVLIVWQIVREVKERRQEAPGEEPERASFNLGATLSGIAWLLAILPMIYLLGFLVTTPLYIFLCLKFRGEKWLLSLIITLIAGTFLYFGLVVALKVPFYKGLLFS